MIAGHVTLADHTINFNAFGGQVAYTVSDNLTGESDTLSVNGANFFMALGLALSTEGEFHPDLSDESSREQWRRCEEVMPKDPVLRWIP